MKKILIFMLSLSLFYNTSAQVLEKAIQSQPNFIESQQIPVELKDLKIEIQKLQELIKKEKSKGTQISKNSSILQKTTSIFTFVVEKADKLLSKKFIIATLIVLAPAATIYCTFFDITPIQNFFYSVSSKTAENAAELGTPIVTGVITGTTKAILHDKEAFTEVIGIWAGINILTSTMSKIGERVAPYIIDGLIKCLNFFPFVYGKAKLLHRG